MVLFGVKHNASFVEVLRSLANRPGEVNPVQVRSPKDSICEHCGQIIVRGAPGQTWKHYPGLKEECHPRPTASPKRDKIGNVIPLTGK